MAKPAKPVRVCVLTGDPRLPDATKRGGRYNEEDAATHAGMKQALESLSGYRFEFLDDHERVFEHFRRNRPDLVLNFCDTGYRNVAAQELHVAALLEMFGIPYSGAPPACMAICYDKQIVRLLAEAQAIPVPREARIDPDQPLDPLPDLYPALIKPNQADGSVGITADARVATPEQARAYLQWFRSALPGRAALMQEYLPGTEYSVGLIGNADGDLEALPLLEVDFSDLPAGLTPILSYESKTIPDSPYWTDIRFRQATVGEAVGGRMIADAKRLFQRLGCRDYARIDFRCDAAGVPRLMEVNPNPAWAYDGKLALMAGFADIPYAEMLRMILNAAVARIVK
jgi:D-alanine-D-alanine ligase